MLKQIKVVVEKHADGYVAYPMGVKGVVVGEGENSWLRLLADFHAGRLQRQYQLFRLSKTLWAGESHR